MGLGPTPEKKVRPPYPYPQLQTRWKLNNVNGPIYYKKTTHISPDLPRSEKVWDRRRVFLKDKQVPRPNCRVLWNTEVDPSSLVPDTPTERRTDTFHPCLVETPCFPANRLPGKSSSGRKRDDKGQNKTQNPTPPNPYISGTNKWDSTTGKKGIVTDFFLLLPPEL